MPRPRTASKQELAVQLRQRFYALQKEESDALDACKDAHGNTSPDFQALAAVWDKRLDDAREAMWDAEHPRRKSKLFYIAGRDAEKKELDDWDKHGVATENDPAGRLALIDRCAARYPQGWRPFHKGKQSPAYVAKQGPKPRVYTRGPYKQPNARQRELQERMALGAEIIKKVRAKDNGEDNVD